MDRLQEMKELFSKLYVMLRGDYYNKSLITEVETSLSLIEKEHKDIESRDHQILEDVFSKTFKDMQDISDQVYKMMQLLSLIQIKYSDSKKKTRVYKTAKSFFRIFKVESDDEELYFKYKYRELRYV